ncbi:MAG: diguanylate cyclase, partial [Clostridiales bacterium]|nr:diguanylate cyclase [Clostridiales bacterium]
MKKRLRRLRMLIVPLFLVAILVAALALYSAQANQRAERLTGELLLASANEQEQMLSVKLEGEFALLSLLAASLGEQEDLAADQALQVTESASAASDFRTLVVADRYGIGVFGEGRTVLLSDQTYYQRTQTGERAVEFVDGTRFGGMGAAVVFAVPIATDERIDGAAIGVLDEQILRELFEANAYGGGETFVCDADGTILSGGAMFETTDEDNLFSILADSGAQDAERMIREIRSGTEGVAEVAIGAQRWYVAYVPAGYGGWTVAQSVPSSLVERMVSEQRSLGNLVIGIATACAILTALFLAGLYSRAIRRSHRERERLLSAEEDYRIAAQQGGMLIVRYDIGSGRILSSSGAIEHFALPNGFEKIDPDRMLSDLVGEESREDFTAIYRAVQRGDASGGAEILMKNTKGRFRWYRFEFAAIGDGGGRSAQAIVTIRDVTAQHERTAAYKRWQNALAASVGLSVALMEINISTGECERVEGEFAAMLDRQSGRQPAQEVLDRFSEAIVAQEDREAFLAFVSPQRLIGLHRRGIQTDEAEVRLLRADGAPCKCVLTVQMTDAPKNDEVKAFLMLKDFENISQEMDRLSDLALRDGLSGLLNRTAARKAIEEALLFGSGETVALFMIDADNFKQVNDLLGHQHGDQALRQMSAVIRKTFRSTDVVARIGGDEFFVFLSEVSGEAFAEAKAAALCETLRFTYFVEERGSISLTASIGVVIAKRSACDYDWLYAEADHALYDAKKAGKNRYSIRSGEGGQGAHGGTGQSGSALQLNSLMRQFDGGVIMLEIGERIEPLFVSDGCFLMQGIMHETVEGKALLDSVIHPHDYPLVEKALRACALDGEPFQISYRNAFTGDAFGWRHMNALRVPNLRGDR